MILFNAGKGFLCKYMIKYDMQIIFYKIFYPGSDFKSISALHRLSSFNPS